VNVFPGDVCVSGFPYLEVAVGFALAVAVLELGLDVLQYRALLSPRPPKALQGVVSESAFAKARAYSLAKAKAAFVRDPIMLAQSLAFLALGVPPKLWAWAGAASEKHLGGHSAGDGTVYGEALHSSLFTLALLGVDTLVGLIPSLHSTFWIEAAHGFNKQSLADFALDLVKSMGLQAVLVPPVILGLVAVARAAGPALVPALWVFLLGLQLLAMAIFPLIASLFNKYEPLPEGPLRAKIEALAARVGFPLRQLYVVDGSRRSAHSNAYMYGFGRAKRIVLYDTLLEQAERDEDVVGVLAHELGHWKLGHTKRVFLASQFVLVAQLALFTLVRSCGPLYASFGFEGAGFGDGKGGESGFPFIVGMALFSHLVAPLDHVLTLAHNGVSRRFEFQADAFGCSLGYRANLRAALVKLQEENASAMNVDPYFSWYHHSHPTLPERLAAMDAIKLDAVLDLKKDQ